MKMLILFLFVFTLCYSAILTDRQIKTSQMIYGRNVMDYLDPAFPKLA